MEKLLLSKVGELALKGLNRKTFESRLLNNIKRKLGNDLKSIDMRQSAIYMEVADGADFYSVRDKVKKVFGITSVSVVYKVGKDIESIKESAYEILRDVLPRHTFKVEAKRSDKKYPLTSPEICHETGGYLLSRLQPLKVDVKSPDYTVMVEIREDNAYIYYDKEPCFCGLPTGTGGKATLLLSGGIDSPVAGFMMAKRGLELNAVHFFSYPYTSERAKKKVIKLAEILGEFVGSFKVYVVPFTEIQLAIRDNCREDMMTLIMRRFMMKIAEKIALKTGSKALITGESLGQVASQTIDSLHVTNSAVDIPVFRPLIGMDKTEITAISRQIDTFETSILPYEDCCTVFTPKHPKTKPHLSEVIREQEKLPIDKLIEDAVNNVEIIEIN